MSSRCVQVVSSERGVELEPLWSSRHVNQNSNMAVRHGGLVYGYDASFLTCVDAETGDLVWRSRPPGDGWVILVDGQLVVLTKAGSLHVVPANPDGYEERAAL
jgi:outer membrane protein assembly factor BamB